MIEKFLKDPRTVAVTAILVLVILAAWIYDEKTNPAKNFYGLLKVKTATV
jgi:hypothetical protein